MVRFLAAILLVLGRESVLEMLTALLGEQPWYVWGSISIICFGGAALILFMPTSWSKRFSSTDIWRTVAYAATVIVLVQFAVLRWDVISTLSERVIATLSIDRPTYDHLRTRPICSGESCDNFEFRVRECELLAVDVGGLATIRRRRERPVLGNRVMATEYYRGCLVDRGLSWEPCQQGEPECRLLRRFTVITEYSVPSFID